MFSFVNCFVVFEVFSGIFFREYIEVGLGFIYRFGDGLLFIKLFSDMFIDGLFLCFLLRLRYYVFSVFY